MPTPRETKTLEKYKGVLLMRSPARRTWVSTYRKAHHPLPIEAKYDFPTRNAARRAIDRYVARQEAAERAAARYVPSKKNKPNHPMARTPPYILRDRLPKDAPPKTAGASQLSLLLLVCLCDKAGATIPEMQRVTGFSEMTVRSYMSSNLRRLGFVARRIGGTRDDHPIYGGRFAGFVNNQLALKGATTDDEDNNER